MGGESVNRFAHVDESALSFEDRLGLAYCRLNTHHWDDLLGEKPEQYDDPITGPRISVAIMARIERILGPAKTSECWWRFTEIGDRDAWLRWYCVDDALIQLPQPVKNPFKRIPHWFGK